MSTTTMIVVGVAVIIAGNAAMFFFVGQRHGLDVLEQLSPRLMQAMQAERESGEVQDGFWKAVEQEHPRLAAAVDFDDQLPAAQRASNDAFWAALRVQDDDFWQAVDRGDVRCWDQLERKHAVQFPIPASAGGGS